MIVLCIGKNKFLYLIGVLCVIIAPNWMIFYYLKLTYIIYLLEFLLSDLYLFCFCILN